MLTILFFGRLSDAAGGSLRTIKLPSGVTDTAALRDWLGRDDPALAAALADPATMVAVDGTVARGDFMLKGGEEVAFMAPVSGG
jgi:molybdopterin converting factor subunit 1